MAKKPTSARLSDESIKMIEEMSEALSISQSELLNLGVKVAHDLYISKNVKTKYEMIVAVFNNCRKV
jgi:BarA-like signal transduction histidine kinase